MVKEKGSGVIAVDALLIPHALRATPASAGQA
jgi:hypothetical protein